MKYKLLTLVISAFMVAGFLAPAAYALQDPGTGGANPSADSCPDNQGDCAKKTSFSFAGCKTEDVGIKCLFVEIITFLSIGVGIAVVAGIAVGGVTYSLAQGNPAGAQKGITIITNAIVGLVLYLLMFALLQFLIPGGILS
jgi:hypothetical protein